MAVVCLRYDDKIAPFLKKDKRKKEYKSNSLGSPFCLCVILVLEIGIAESMERDDKQTKKRTVLSVFCPVNSTLVWANGFYSV